MGVVQHRIVVDDHQRTRTDHLNVGLKAAVVIDELGRLDLLCFCRPGFSLGHPDQIHDRVLDALVGPDLNQRLLAGAITYVEILVRDDLPRL